MIALFASALLLASCNAVAIHSDGVELSPVVVDMVSLDEMSYTANISISGHPVPIIIDTGSFEIVAFQEGCGGCPYSSTTFFNPERAGGDLRVAETRYVLTYGSGSATTKANFATVGAGALHARDQLFWLADDVRFDFQIGDDSGGIFGLGPPASSLAFAEMLMQYAQENGNQERANQLKKVAELEKQESPFLLTVSSSVFSVCLMQGSGPFGKLIFNDHEVIDNWVEVAPTSFWEVKMSNIKVGGMALDSQYTQCTALIDSGTSLIGMPKVAYDKLVVFVDEFAAQHGCRDLSMWPQLELEVGGQTLSLPPDSYVAQMANRWDVGDDAFIHVNYNPAISQKETINRLMPHLKRHDNKTKVNTMQQALHDVEDDFYTCEAMVFFLGNQFDQCQFLFGLPLFREYYVSHELDTTSGKGRRMAFSKGSEDCTGRDADRHTLTRSVPFKVNPGKLRFPTHRKGLMPMLD